MDLTVDGIFMDTIMSLEIYFKMEQGWKSSRWPQIFILKISSFYCWSPQSVKTKETKISYKL